MKDFYIELSDIIRRYIEGRYYITALEETSSEILHDIKEQDLYQNLYNNLKELLELSDFVKFAKYIPTEKENQNAPENAKQFINETKIEFKIEEEETEKEKV